MEKKSDAPVECRPHVRYGGSIPAQMVGDLSDQMRDRLNYLRWKYPNRDYTYKTMAYLMGSGKAWVSDFFLKKYVDVRISSLYRLATVLGCDLKIVLIPKESTDESRRDNSDRSSESLRQDSSE